MTARVRRWQHSDDSSCPFSKLLELSQVNLCPIIIAMGRITFIVTNARTRQRAVGACGGVGPGEAARIKAHDASVGSRVEIAAKLHVIIIPTYGSTCPKVLRCRAQMHLGNGMEQKATHATWR